MNARDAWIMKNATTDLRIKRIVSKSSSSSLITAYYARGTGQEKTFSTQQQSQNPFHSQIRCQLT